MVHGRSNEARFHVRGFSDRGTTTTAFDMVVSAVGSRPARLQIFTDA
jgi:xylulose-5-phosphate/fructose-6-phosphate phosphoketolase